MSKIIRPYGDKDPHASIELIASTVVHSEKFTADQMPSLAARVSHADSGKTGDNPEDDLKLMNYLGKHKHMTPFEHQSVTFKIVTPLFVRSEWHRHRTQSFSEISMRYTDDPVGKLFIPEVWRKQCTRNKQGSAEPIESYHQEFATNLAKKTYTAAMEGYEAMIKLGVCREQARIFVPVGNYTEFYATANLRNWYGFYALRHAEDAQQEIRVYAEAIDEILTELWPESWGSLKESLKNQ